jgi:CelD/BcsL family acetyltransferase involved in cellulose biosynthesis
MTNAEDKLKLEPTTNPNSRPDLANTAARFSLETVVDVEGQPIRITSYRSWAQFEEIVPAWENILDENPRLSIFSTPEWMGSWWKAFGGGRQLVALAFLNETGELLGLAPLYRDDSLFGRVKCLRLVGDGSKDSDNLDLIIRPGSEKACVQSFLGWLADQPDWDFCCLNTVDENSLAVNTLMRQLKARKWPMVLAPSHKAAVHLPGTWESYVKSLNSDFRPLVTRYPQRLSNRYKVRVSRCEHYSEICERLEALFSLHQKRWNKANEPGSFGSRARRQFYFDIAESFLQRGWLELWSLELNGAVVAVQFCFRYRDTGYILQEGFDPDFAHEKVGYALRAAMLQHFIHLGIRQYDFLGGFNLHKQNWGARPGSYWNLGFATPGALGHRYLIFDKLASDTKAWIRHRLPYGVWNALYRLKMQTYGKPVSDI